MNNALHKGTMLHTAIAMALAGGAGSFGNPRPRQPVALPSRLPPPEPKPHFTKQPGILDRIRACESSEEAHTLFYSFLDSANCVSQKTINRAARLLATLDFPKP